jgi:hypothetical protein
MPFKKGQSGNTNGRPKGSTNKDTEFKKAIKEGISIEEIIADIKLLPPRDRIDRLLRVLEFAYPKMKAVEVSGEITDGRPEIIEVIVRKPDAN